MVFLGPCAADLASRSPVRPVIWHDGGGHLRCDPTRSARRRFRIRRVAALGAVLATKGLLARFPFLDGGLPDAADIPSQCSDQGRSGKGSLDISSACETVHCRKQLRAEQLADTLLQVGVPCLGVIIVAAPSGDPPAPPAPLDGEAEASASPAPCQALNACVEVTCSIQSAASGTLLSRALHGGSVDDFGCSDAVLSVFTVDYGRVPWCIPWRGRSMRPIGVANPSPPCTGHLTLTAPISLGRRRWVSRGCTQTSPYIVLPSVPADVPAAVGRGSERTWVRRSAAKPPE